MKIPIKYRSVFSIPAKHRPNIISSLIATLLQRCYQGGDTSTDNHDCRVPDSYNILCKTRPQLELPNYFPNVQLSAIPRSQLYKIKFIPKEQIAPPQRSPQLCTTTSSSRPTHFRARPALQ